MLHFAYRLALELGIADVHSMLEGMTAKQLLGWLAFYQLEPFGDERMDARFAVLDTLVVRAAGGKAKPEQFMWSSKPKALTQARDIEALLMGLYHGARRGNPS